LEREDKPNVAARNEVTMKSKLLLGLALVLSGGFFNVANIARCADEPSAIKVIIDIPEFGWDGKITGQRTLENRYPNYDHFYVVIENISAKPVFLAEGNGVMGGLSFEITTVGNTNIVVNRRPLLAAKYVAGEFSLSPGQATVVEIVYGRDWERFPFPQDSHYADQKSTVTIRAVLEVKPAIGSATLKGYWTGKVISEPYEVVLVNNAL
jgi:hypothetical protein